MSYQKLQNVDWFSLRVLFFCFYLKVFTAALREQTLQSQYTKDGITGVFDLGRNLLNHIKQVESQE